MKYRKKPVVIEAYQTEKELDIETLEGTMHASVGDYIITGVRGEQYPCKPDIFEQTYEPADAPTAAPWHRVEEELPNVDEKVLVFAVGKLDGFIGDTVIALTSMSDTNWLNHHEKVDKPYWLDPWQYFLTDYRITHWMPLPEPPKED